jgi:hypothetical protein
MKMTVFWDVAPCSLVETDWRFRGAYCHHHQDDELITQHLYFFCYSYSPTHAVMKKKVKALPLHAMGAPGGERRYSSYSYLTSALDGGEWSASCPGRALPPGKAPPVPIVQEAGWAPEPVWTQRLEEKSSVGDRTPVVQSVVRHYTYWATPTPMQ